MEHLRNMPASVMSHAVVAIDHHCCIEIKVARVLRSTQLTRLVLIWYASQHFERMGPSPCLDLLQQHAATETMTLLETPLLAYPGRENQNGGIRQGICGRAVRLVAVARFSIGISSAADGRI